MPLHYVLMFPRDKDGWHPNIPICDKSTLTHDEEISEIGDEDKVNISNKCTIVMNYFTYQLQVGCSEEALTLYWYGWLFQQWIVDIYAVIEQTRLNYLRHNQKQIRAKQYNGLQDTINSRDSLTNIGQWIILPSSFTGRPQQMHKLYQNGMAIV